MPCLSIQRTLNPAQTAGSTRDTGRVTAYDHFYSSLLVDGHVAKLLLMMACLARWHVMGPAMEPALEPVPEPALEPAMDPAMEPAGQDAVQLEVVEGQLTWLVHIIGAVIRGRLSSSTAESQETLDGDLTARAFGLLQIVDSGYAAHAIQHCCWKT